MTIKQQITNDMMNARRNRDKSGIQFYGMALDRIQKREKELLREVSEDEAMAVVRTFIKNLGEEKEGYVRRGDSDKVTVIEAQEQLLAKYLPAQLSKEDVAKAVENLYDEMVRRAGFSAPQITKGDVMKEVMSALKGKADNRLIAQAVNEFLK